MSIDTTKMVATFKPVSPHSKVDAATNGNDKKFKQVFERTVNPHKIIENSQLKAAELARFSQLHLLQGLFSSAEEKGDDDFFSSLQQLESLQKTVAQKSQIIDKYYAAQQPSLLRPGQPGRSEIDQMIDKVAKKFSLSPQLIHSVVAAESAYNPTAVSNAGAQGLMQLMPETAKELGVQDSFNPQQNLFGGSKYLKQLLDKYEGDLDSALAAYNWGPGNVDRHGLEKMPTETRNYLAKIKSQIGIKRT